MDFFKIEKSKRNSTISIDKEKMKKKLIYFFEEKLYHLNPYEEIRVLEKDEFLKNTKVSANLARKRLNSKSHNIKNDNCWKQK